MCAGDGACLYGKVYVCVHAWVYVCAHAHVVNWRLVVHDVGAWSRVRA